MHYALLDLVSSFQSFYRACSRRFDRRGFFVKQALSILNAPGFTHFPSLVFDCGRVTGKSEVSPTFAHTEQLHDEIPILHETDMTKPARKSGRPFHDCGTAANPPLTTASHRAFPRPVSPFPTCAILPFAVP